MTGQPTRLQRLSYGLTGLPLAVLSLPLVVYLPALYTQELGLSLLAVGGALLLARLFDVFSDLFIGSFTDRLRERGIARKLPMLVGVPILLIGIEQLFAPDATVSFWTLLLWSLVAYLGWTLIAVPYYAWGAELSADAHVRTQLAGNRETFTILGVAVVIFIPALTGIADQPAAILAAVAASLWWLLPAALLLSLLLVPEPAPRRSVTRKPIGATGAVGALAALRANRPLRRLLGAYVLSNVANALPATLFIFFITHVLAAQDRIGFFLGIYFLAAIVALPAWVMLARRLGKQRTWVASMLLATLGFAAAPWLGAGDIALYTAICLFTGIAYGADLALPASIQADMVDLDRRYAGRGRAGLLFGLWGLATKLAAALGVALAFGLLALAGFDPQADNSQTTLGLLALLYGLVPILFKLIAIGLSWRLPNLQRDPDDTTPILTEDPHHVQITSDSADQPWTARRVQQHAT